MRRAVLAKSSHISYHALVCRVFAQGQQKFPEHLNQKIRISPVPGGRTQRSSRLIVRGHVHRALSVCLSSRDLVELGLLHAIDRCSSEWKARSQDLRCSQLSLKCYLSTHASDYAINHAKQRPSEETVNVLSPLVRWVVMEKACSDSSRERTGTE